MTRYAMPIAAFVLAVAGLFAGVWWWSYVAALDRLAERGQSDLAVASDRLVGQLQRYRGFAVLLADHPDVFDLLEGNKTGSDDRASSAAHDTLLEAADKTGSAEIYVLNAAGQLLVSSSEESFAGGRDFSQTPYFRRAMHAALGIHHSSEGGERAFFFAAPVNARGQAPMGAVVVKVDLYSVDAVWRVDPQAVFFSNNEGVVFASNRAELLQLDTSEDLSGNAITVTAKSVVSGHEIWELSEDRYLPKKAMHIATQLPVIGMNAEILIDTGPAQRVAILQGAIAASACLIFGALALILLQRRAALAESLAIEEKAKAALELRVAERTRELSDVNANLRREVGERLEAEAALKKAQKDLVRAGKLSALGKMSAGISHELNQPLMAIRSFAENAEIFLDRGREDVARENIGRISDLARRMGRIIKNLRAFARHESEAVTDVDLGRVVGAVLEISENRLSASQVRVDWTPPRRLAMVRGGEVRLQQVVMNLLSNAIDAMEDQAEKRITIEIEQQAGKTCLSVADTGPGLSEAEKIFDPFYTTKEVGHSEGMGLGLSISYGIVQSFGGVISGRNGENGGAVFTVELTPCAMEQAA